jgi:hypothetical protein
MNIRGPREAPPVVTLPAQAINPLSASPVPITMSLPAKVDLAQKSGHGPAHEAHEVHKAAQVQQQQRAEAQAVQQAQVTTMINVSGVAQAGKVDVYV